MGSSDDRLPSGFQESLDVLLEETDVRQDFHGGQVPTHTQAVYRAKGQFQQAGDLGLGQQLGHGELLQAWTTLIWSRKVYTGRLPPGKTFPSLACLGRRPLANVTEKDAP